MSKIDLKSLTIKSAHDHLVNKDFSAVDLATAYLDEIKKKNKELNAYLEVYDDVLSQAKEADKRIAFGERDLLLGIPLAVKDNILIEGKRATSASKILKGYIAPYDATVISKLKEAGAIFLGRTNMDEFATGSSTENSAFGVTKNPHDLSRVAGGSSGGSVATVAANMALGALGSETGGSIRQPASLCGVVGLKTTYGRVSRYGLMAMASSLDQIGPIAKTVTDTEIIFNAIKGRDSMDSTTFPDELYPKRKNKKKFAIGVPKIEGIKPDIKKSFEESLKKLEKLGHEIKNINMPNIKYALPAYYVIVPAEVSSNLARFDGIRYGLHKDGRSGIEDYFFTRGEGFGKEVRRRILLGTYVLSSGYYDAYYNKAVEVRELVTKDFEKAFKEVDLIAMPTTPGPAFKIGEKVSDPVAMYLEDVFTVTANIAGVPAISLPSGFSEVDGKKLPLGLQLMAPHNHESFLFSIGKRFNGE